MSFSQKVMTVVDKIAIFSIESGKRDPNGVRNKTEEMRLMEKSLELQLQGKAMDSRQARGKLLPRKEIEDFNRELMGIEKNIIELYVQLEIRSRYPTENPLRSHGTPTPATTGARSHSARPNGQFSVPSTSTSERSFNGSASTPYHGMCPNCAARAAGLSPSSLSSSSYHSSCSDSGFESLFRGHY